MPARASVNHAKPDFLPRLERKLAPDLFLTFAPDRVRDMRILAWSYWQADAGTSEARLELAELLLDQLAMELQALSDSFADYLKEQDAAA